MIRMDCELCGSSMLFVVLLIDCVMIRSDCLHCFTTAVISFAAEIPMEHYSTVSLLGESSTERTSFLGKILMKMTW